MDRLLEVGQKMGLEGKELQSFVSEQLVIEHDERQREREFKRAQMKAEEASTLREREFKRAQMESENMSQSANKRKTVGYISMN